MFYVLVQLSYASEMVMYADNYKKMDICFLQWVIGVLQSGFTSNPMRRRMEWNTSQTTHYNQPEEGFRQK